MRILLSLIMFFGFGCMCGCAAHTEFEFGLEHRQITIITEPEGASVTQFQPMGGGAYLLGVTPLTERTVTVVSEIRKIKNLPQGTAMQLFDYVGNINVSIEKSGFKPYRGLIGTSKGQTIVHEIKLIPEDMDN